MTREVLDKREKLKATINRLSTVLNQYIAQGSVTKDYANLCSVKKEVRQGLKFIENCALKPDPLTQLEYIQLLITSEKQEKNPGWLHRVKCLEECKGQTALSDVINVDNKIIDQQIEKERRERHSGWEERVEKLKQLR